VSPLISSERLPGHGVRLDLGLVEVKAEAEELRRRGDAGAVDHHHRDRICPAASRPPE